MVLWKKSVVVLACLVIIAGGIAGWSHASPWITMNHVKKAAEQGDIMELNKLVDWNSVKDKMTIEWGRRALVSGGLTSSDERVLEVILAVEDSINNMATAENTVTLFRKAKESGEKALVKGVYLNMGTYVVAIESEDKKSAFTVVLKRQGPFSWKVVEVIMLDSKSLASGN